MIKPQRRDDLRQRFRQCLIKIEGARQGAIDLIDCGEITCLRVHSITLAARQKSEQAKRQRRGHHQQIARRETVRRKRKGQTGFQQVQRGARDDEDDGDHHRDKGIPDGIRSRHDILRLQYSAI